MSGAPIFNCLIPCLFLAGISSGCSHAAIASVGKSKLVLLRPRDQTLERGKIARVYVQVDRHNVQDPVSLTIERLPPGVRLANPELTIPRGEQSVLLTLEADPSAEPVMDHRVFVTARAPPDIQATESFGLTIKP